MPVNDEEEFTVIIVKFEEEPRNLMDNQVQASRQEIEAYLNGLQSGQLGTLQNARYIEIIYNRNDRLWMKAVRRVDENIPINTPINELLNAPINSTIPRSRGLERWDTMRITPIDNIPTGNPTGTIYGRNIRTNELINIFKKHFSLRSSGGQRRRATKKDKRSKRRASRRRRPT